MRDIFVFGSNLAGRHGKGAALHAKRYYGAIYRQGEGRQGDSYAIPTKDEYLRTLSLDAIQAYVTNFRKYVDKHLEDSLRLRYILTAVGCGLAGYKPANIAPMFDWALRAEYLHVINGEFIRVVLLPEEFNIGGAL